MKDVFHMEKLWEVLIFIGGGNTHHMCLHQTNQLPFILEVFSLIKLKENTGFGFTFVWLVRASLWVQQLFFVFYQILAHWAQTGQRTDDTHYNPWIVFLVYFFWNHGRLLAAKKTKHRTVLRTLKHFLTISHPSLGKHRETPTDANIQ